MLSQGLKASGISWVAISVLAEILEFLFWTGLKKILAKTLLVKQVKMLLQLTLQDKKMCANVILE